MNKIFKYRKYEYKINKRDNGFYSVEPVNFSTLACISGEGIEETKQKFKKYIDRVTHYNK